MSTNISRRKVVAGAAWAAPVVAASAVVPAFASSTECEDKKTPAYSIEGTSAGAKTVQKFKVPANVDKINFVAIGGPGGTQYSAVPGGASAQISGTIAVKEGQVVEIVAAAGGVGNFPLDPSEGGEGYGNGGSSKGTDAIPASVVSKVNAVWPGNSQLKRRLFSSSGGGSSAVLIDGVPVAVAGGGGGVTRATMFTTEPDPDHFPGIVDARMIGPENQTRPPVLSVGGSGERARGGDATTGREYYAQDPSVQLTVEGGKGGGNGIGGAGGAKPTVLTGTPNDIFSFDSQNKQVLYSSSTAGNPGTNGLQGNGGDGVMSVSYQLDNHDMYSQYYETLRRPDGTYKYLSYYHLAPYFNGAQVIVSGGGGGGYGGGGSGAALSQSAITIAQKWNNNPTGARQSISSAQLAGAGGAGGSYLAPSVIEGEISRANNAYKGSQYGQGGTATVYLCEV